MTKQTAPIKGGMVVGGFFHPISSKTPLGQPNNTHTVHMGLTICTMIEIVQSGFLDGVLGFLVHK